MKRSIALFLLLSRYFHVAYSIVSDDRYKSGGAGGDPASSAVVLIDRGLQVNDPSFCMGALLNGQVVITVANCCEPKVPFDVIVTIGSTLLHDEGSFYYAKKYKTLGDKSDPPKLSLCLIKLNRKVSYSRYALPVGLPRTSDELIKEDNFEIFGFGSLHPNQPGYLSHEMQRIKLPMQALAECEGTFGSLRVEEKFLCIGAKTGARLSLDDNGAPLIRDRMLFGLGLTHLPYLNKTAAAQKNPQYYISIAPAVNRILAELQDIMKQKI